MRRLVTTAAVGAVLATACVLDWDRYDPLQDGAGLGGMVPAGGGGGATTTTTTTSSAGGLGGMPGTGGAGGTGGEPMLGPFGTPEPLFPNLEDDDDPSLTADGLQLFFNSLRGGDPDVWVSVRSDVNDPWPTPSAVTELNSPNNETNLTVSPDGLTMWLQSDRADPGNGSPLYVSTRATPDGTWSTPVLADDPMLTAPGFAEIGGVTADGLVMLGRLVGEPVCGQGISERASTAEPWPAPGALTSINEGGTACEAWLAPDGLTTYFGSSRDGGQGSSDIMVATRSSRFDPFGAPTFVAEVSSSINESDPTLTGDERTIVIARSVSGQRDLFVATR